MSCGERSNSDEFDPIPVLISKNTNQGKFNRMPKWVLALLKQIHFSQLFLVTTVAWRLYLLKLFYQSNLSNKPSCSSSDAVLLLCHSKKMIPAYIVSPHTFLCSAKNFTSHYDHSVILHILLLFHRLFHAHLCLFLFLPLLFLSGTFQVVTHTATVAVQSPTSPTWLAPFCWWISSSTSKGVGEVEGAVCKPIREREGGNRDGKSRDI